MCCSSRQEAWHQTASYNRDSAFPKSPLLSKIVRRNSTTHFPGFPGSFIVGWRRALSGYFLFSFCYLADAGGLQVPCVLFLSLDWRF